MWHFKRTVSEHICSDILITFTLIKSGMWVVQKVGYTRQESIKRKEKRSKNLVVGSTEVMEGLDLGVEVERLRGREYIYILLKGKEKNSNRS